MIIDILVITVVLVIAFLIYLYIKIIDTEIEIEVLRALLKERLDILDKGVNELNVTIDENNNLISFLKDWIKDKRKLH